MKCKDCKQFKAHIFLVDGRLIKADVGTCYNKRSFTDDCEDHTVHKGAECMWGLWKRKRKEDFNQVKE